MQEDVHYRLGLESQLNTERELIPESEYHQSLTALNRTGVLSILPESERLGIIGIDGKEYPIPSFEEVLEVLSHNRELIEAKRGQGLTRLQITPLAMPIPLLIDRAQRAILKHDREGKIYQTKSTPDNPNVTVQVDRSEPVWIWDTVKEALKTDDIVYFPRRFDANHQGRSKDEVIRDPAICPIPGWSIGLVEDMKFLPQQGKGQTIGGRAQLENNLTPKNYIQSLQADAYAGETGWTYEDVLTDFLINLENANEVSHEWRENNVVWLTGSYLPGSAGVPRAYWSRDYGRLDVGASGPGYRDGRWGVRSTVRLGL